MYLKNNYVGVSNESAIVNKCVSYHELDNYCECKILQISESRMS